MIDWIDRDRAVLFHSEQSPVAKCDFSVVAAAGRREKVFNQFIRPSFHALAGQCEFLSFEMVDDAVSRIESLKGGKALRVSGLLEGERFQLQDQYIYPTGV